jgi:hypothetical protein
MYSGSRKQDEKAAIKEQASGRPLSWRNEPETTAIIKMNSSTAYFHSANMNTSARGGFVGNFTSEEGKKERIPFLPPRDRLWLKEYHAFSSRDTRLSRALHHWLP